FLVLSTTYDHRVWRTGLPVRSAVLKPHAGRLVVGWVTTSESLLLYVFVPSFLFLFSISPIISFFHYLFVFKLIHVMTVWLHLYARLNRFCVWWDGASWFQNATQYKVCITHHISIIQLSSRIEHPIDHYHGYEV
ncbi:hypothetical protein BO94DRAFT_477670, partial [Aspergillus sclerotioniger CBS 115572]